MRHLLDGLMTRVNNVALNVETTNEPAIQCYRKFGFTDRYRFIETWLEG